MKTTQITNEVFRMAKAVDYEPGKPVFNQLLNARYGGVNLVAIPGGVEVAEHTAPAQVAVYVLEGEIDFRINGEKHTMLPGDALLMAAGTPHSVHPKADSKFLLIKVED